MAFVYREERKTIEQRPQSSLGPGQYLPITQTRKIKPNKDKYILKMLIFDALIGIMVLILRNIREEKYVSVKNETDI